MPPKAAKGEYIETVRDTCLAIHLYPHPLGSTHTMPEKNPKLTRTRTRETRSRAGPKFTVHSTLSSVERLSFRPKLSSEGISTDNLPPPPQQTQTTPLHRQTLRVSQSPSAGTATYLSAPSCGHRVGYTVVYTHTTLSRLATTSLSANQLLWRLRRWGIMFTSGLGLRLVAWLS